MKSIGCGIGIDLGAANTCTAVFRANDAEIVPHQGNPSMPSCVAFTETCRLVGSAAKDQASVNSTNTIFDALRFVGRDISEPNVQKMIKDLPFKVIEKNGGPAFLVEYRGKELITTPMEILAMILARAQRDAQTYLGKGYHITGAVITIPTYFNFCQRQTIWDAACVAKITPLRLVSATAMTCALYALTNWEPGIRNVLCIDFGAGSLDVAVAIIEEGIVEIKAVDGDTFLGGADFDTCLVRRIATTLRQTWNHDSRGVPRQLCRMRTACEKAKCILSSQDRTHIELDTLAEGRDFAWSLTRRDLEECCNDLLQICYGPIERILKDTQMNRDDIYAVIVTGGSSQIPKFLSLLSQAFGEQKISKSLNPDQAAARGAAYHARVLCGDNTSGDLENILLLDIAPLSVGIATAGDTVARILQKNTTIPTTKAGLFTTFEDNQKNYPISVFEGERTQTKDNLLLGKLTLDLDPAPRGEPNIEVSIHYSTNNYVLVVAKEEKSGKMEQVRLSDPKRLPQHKLKSIIAEHAEFDSVETIEEWRIEAKNSSEEYVVTLLEELAARPDTSATKEKMQLANSVLEWLDANPDAQASAFRVRLNDLKRKIEGVVDVDNQQDGLIKRHTPEEVPAAINYRKAKASEHAPQHSGSSAKSTTSLPADIHSPEEEVAEKAKHSDLSTVSSHDHHANESYHTAPQNSGSCHTDEEEEKEENPKQRGTMENRVNAPPTRVDSPNIPSPTATEIISTPLVSPSNTPHTVEFGINDLFSRPAGSNSVYTDSEFIQVSTYLQNTGQPSWSAVPRLYTVLRLLNQLDMLDTFIEQGITDIWFPFTQTSLPNTLSPTARARFIDQQTVVFSKSLLFEASAHRKHAHFAHGEPLPFQVVAKLGAGAHGQVDKVMSTISHREYARKQFRRQRGTSKDAIRSFLVELQVLKRVQHHHCIELVRFDLPGSSI
jgi:heat shock protein 1/8